MTHRYFPAVLAFAALLGLAGCGATTGKTPSSAEQAKQTVRLYLGLSADDVRTAMSTVQAALETLPSRRTMSWTNGRGTGGAVTPVRTYKTAENFYCREYVEVVTTSRSGNRETRRIACRDRDRRWKQVRR